MTRWFSLRHVFRRSEPVASPWLPPALEPDDATDDDAARTISPLAAPVHVCSGAAVVRVENGVLVVEREGAPRVERPIELVSAVHIHGWATVTSPCIGELIRQGTPVIWRGAPTGGTEFTAFLEQPIEGDRPCPRIDATCVMLRQNGRIVSVAVAVGVNDDVRREIPGLGLSEAATLPTAFLRQLARRRAEAPVTAVRQATGASAHAAKLERV